MLSAFRILAPLALFTTPVALAGRFSVNLRGFIG